MGAGSSLLGLGDHDDRSLTAAALDAERDHVPGADAVDRRGSALDLFGEHVAAADDDHVLDPAAHHHFAVDEVAEVAGAEPAVAERVGRRLSGRR